MNNASSNTQSWKPLAPEKVNRIRQIFSDLFPVSENEDLANRISEYWINKLEKIWEKKHDAIRQKDIVYHPGDPLSRISQKTVVIAYADSVSEKDEKTLTTLDDCLSQYFPAVNGLHILPACLVAAYRFNDGYFSQILRNEIHPPFGTNKQFANMAKKYFSMADFVLNHVDIDNPKFQSYLNGNDVAGDCFFIFSEDEYQKHLSDGDFDQIFHPRPFPLFSIFRKTPTENRFARKDFRDRVKAMNKCFSPNVLPNVLPDELIALLSVFNKIKNDQMLRENDYTCITQFIEYLKNKTTVTPDSLFTLSKAQETIQPPYIFRDFVKTKKDLLTAIGYDSDTAQRIADIFEENDALIFGEEIRALTTFSHVQVDLNTSTYEGLRMLMDDFAWYLSMDLNMLRLDAANFAFKRWKTTCFGLPEVKSLMEVLYLSMECVAPRIVANLEVNDQLSAVLNQMADKNAPPPMMYDFHLAGILPVIFNTHNADIAGRIFEMIRQYDIPKESIRFSIAETHDGKSVRGSMDLLTPSERQGLARIVETNGGKIKNKAGIHGQEPYELCTSTRDALIRLDDPALEADRFLAFYTMAFALMGRHVKSIYFNDLLGLGNDYDRMDQTGELRDIKRTKSDYDFLKKIFSDPDSFHSKIAKHINNLIALADTDPALHFRGNEAEMISTGNPAVACIYNHCREDYTYTLINTSGEKQTISVDLSVMDWELPKAVIDHFTQSNIDLKDGTLTLETGPFQRLWIKDQQVDIAKEKRIE